MRARFAPERVCGQTVPMPMHRTSDLSGIAAMLAATAVFVVSDSFLKLVTEDLPTFEVLFLRSIAASLACAVLVALRGEWRAISGVLDRSEEHTSELQSRQY